MDVKIDSAAVMELAAQKIANTVMYQDHDIEKIAKRMIEARIEKLWSEKVEASLIAAIDASVMGALDQEYRKVDAFGQGAGEPTTLRKQLDRLATDYWSQPVDNNGKPASSSYGTELTRAEYLMAKICAEDFSAQMKQAAVSVTAALKDGFRKQLAGHVDGLLDELFRVKSLQDQGKASKVW